MDTTSNQEDVLLKARELRKGFGGRSVLKSVNFDLRRGQVVLLRGENGSGKTTLLNILTGNLEPDFGVAPADAAVQVSPFRLYNDELTVIGSMAVLHSFGSAVELLANGAVNVGPLIAEPVPLERFGQAVDRVRGGQGIKSHVRP